MSALPVTLVALRYLSGKATNPRPIAALLALLHACNYVAYGVGNVTFAKSPQQSRSCGWCCEIYRVVYQLSFWLSLAIANTVRANALQDYLGFNKVTSG